MPRLPLRLLARRSDGFWLVEAVVAVGVLAVVSASMAELAMIANRASIATRDRTVARLAAIQKMEQLRALSWTYRDPGAVPVTDTTTDLGLDPPGSGGRGLRVSPAGSLAGDHPGYVDYLDGEGRWRPRAAGARYVRRWSVRWLGRSDRPLLALDVVVMPATYADRVQGAEPGSTDPGVVWLATLRARR